MNHAFASIATALMTSVTPAAAAPGIKALAVPRYVAAAIADPRRPPDQVARDALRKPAEVISFSGLMPGNKVADFIPGTGYFTRIFSDIVGPSGRVYAINPAEFGGIDPAFTILAADKSCRNIIPSVAFVMKFVTPEPLDLVWTSDNYHDLHDSFMNHADVGVVNRAIFRALKPGGIYIVIDHVAQPGSGLRDTETLHRIDPAAIVREVTAAGFVLEGTSNLLRRPADDHTLRVINPKIKGHTDQIILKFRKPRANVRHARH